MVNNPSTATLSPFNTLNTPSGRTGLLPQLAPSTAPPTAPSHNGFTTTVLPAAIATGKNHIGTIAGKLNGQMIPHHPQRLLYRNHIHLRRRVLGERLPSSDAAIPHANSTTS